MSKKRKIIVKDIRIMVEIPENPEIIPDSFENILTKAVNKLLKKNPNWKFKGATLNFHNADISNKHITGEIIATVIFENKSKSVNNRVKFIQVETFSGQISESGKLQSGFFRERYEENLKKCVEKNSHFMFYGIIYSDTVTEKNLGLNIQEEYNRTILAFESKK